MLFNSFDYIVFSIVFIIALIGLIRGFIKEITSVINWCLTIYLTTALKPYVINLFKEHIDIPFIADMVTNAVLFIFFIIVISIITSNIGDKCKKFISTEVNGILGLLSGALKAYLIIIFTLSIMITINSNIKWLQKSYIYNILNDKIDKFKPFTETLLGEIVKDNVEQVESLDTKVKELKQEFETKTKEFEDKKENIKETINQYNELVNKKDINFDSFDFEKVDELKKILQDI